VAHDMKTEREQRETERIQVEKMKFLIEQNTRVEREESESDRNLRKGERAERQLLIEDLGREQHN